MTNEVFISKVNHNKPLMVELVRRGFLSPTMNNDIAIYQHYKNNRVTLKQTGEAFNIKHKQQVFSIIKKFSR